MNTRTAILLTLVVLSAFALSACQKSASASDYANVPPPSGGGCGVAAPVSDLGIASAVKIDANSA